MQQVQAYRFLKEAETREKLRAWWESLKHKRGDRARLRRAEEPSDVLLTEPFFRFLHQMPETWSKENEIITSAIVAAALAHVKEINDGATFATQLALPKASSKKKARMSELRFRQLQKSSTPDEFFIRIVRAIRLTDSKVNIYSLAESILHWMNEYRYGVDREPQKRLAVGWATDYYTSTPEQQ